MPHAAVPEPEPATRPLGPIAAIVILVLAALAVVAGPAQAQDAGGEDVPGEVVAPLGAERPSDAAAIGYGELVRAADEGRLNAAVIDRSARWVSAVDGEGNVIAARIPEAEAGRDFADAAAASRITPGSGLPGTFDLEERLRAGGVAVLPAASGDEEGSGGMSAMTRMLILPLSFAVIAVFIIGGMYLIRGRNAGGRGAGGRGGAGSHGKIRKSAKVPPPPVRFTDVAGCDEAVEELEEVVTFLREPGRFQRVGARMPRGVILHGPPGTGKTLLAKAVAGEAGVPFFAISGSDFVDTYVGVGASRVRDLFAQARASEEGAIIFFDEIDAIGRARGAGGSSSDSEREGTLNQLLVELDGFGARERVVVIAATNRLDMLDKALLRPGRFDRRVQVALPAEAGRLAILRLHSSGMPISDPSALAGLARVTAGFAGADLANIVNEAAIMAARSGRETILPGDLDEGMLRAVAGPQRADRRIGEGEIEVIAWHEAGHALAAEICPTHAKAHRVTILSRGDAGGLALFGGIDRTLTGQQHLHERMVVALAGRAAEQIRFGAISSGAANDLEQVSMLAREAIERLGFSPRVGQIVVPGGPQPAQVSGETRRLIDEEIARMVGSAYDDAVALLTDHRPELDRLAEALLENEQVDRAELEDLVGTASSGEGRRRPARADALPEPRVVPAPPPPPEPAPARRSPEPVAAAPEPAGTEPEPVAGGPPRRARRRLRLPPPAGRRRGRRLRSGVEAAAASVYALTLPRLRAAPGGRLRRLRRKRPGIA